MADTGRASLREERITRFTIITSDGSRWTFGTDSRVRPEDEAAVICGSPRLPVNPNGVSGEPSWRIRGSAVVAWRREDDDE